MSSNSINGTSGSNLSSTIAAGNVAAGQSASSDQSKNWLEAMAKAWGGALDNQAGKIENLSNQLGSSVDGGSSTTAAGSSSTDPSVLTNLTTASLEFQFLSSSASTSINAAGQALDTLGRKQ